MLKKKTAFNVVFVFFIITSILSLGFNIYFLATKPKEPSGIFNNIKDNILELKAETETIGTSYGSAILISKDGIIITNAHVISYKKVGETYLFENIEVRFINEEEYRSVSVVKYDLSLDVAVLKLEPFKEFKTLTFNLNNDLKYGDRVYAVGNMSNNGISLTIGSISIPSINVKYDNNIRSVIQCDLVISDGNSGGALVDKDGKLLGMTTFRLKDTSNNIIYGISYSIPASTILEYIKST